MECIINKQNLYKRDTFIFSKKNKIINDNINIDNFFNLNICTINTRLSQSVNYKNKIDELLEFIKVSDLDIICLQGICDTKILKLIAKKIYILNKEVENIGYSMFPMIDQFYFQHDATCYNSDDIIKMTWSNSNDMSLLNIDCLIISKYDIISGTKIELKGYIKNKYAVVANINVNGILISIYNVSLTGDYIGTINSSIRKYQIKQLKSIISSNLEKIKTDNLYSKYNIRGIHIISCLGCMQELLNDEINDEYLSFTRTLKSIDIYRYIQSLKSIIPDNSIDSTNVEGYRSNYILLYCENPINLQTPDSISEKIYDNHKIVVINSMIIKLLKLYEDYPVVATFMIENVLNNLNNSDIKSVKSIDSDVAIEIIDT